MQLTDQINNSFEKNHFTLGVFIDLSNAFVTVDQYIFLTKLKECGIKGNNLRLFHSFLKSSKQSIIYDNKNATFADITSVASQRFYIRTFTN